MRWLRVGARGCPGREVRARRRGGAPGRSERALVGRGRETPEGRLRRWAAPSLDNRHAARGRHAHQQRLRAGGRRARGRPAEQRLARQERSGGAGRRPRRSHAEPCGRGPGVTRRGSRVSGDGPQRGRDGGHSPRAPRRGPVVGPPGSRYPWHGRHAAPPGREADAGLDRGGHDRRHAGLRRVRLVRAKGYRLGPRAAGRRDRPHRAGAVWDVPRPAPPGAHTARGALPVRRKPRRPGRGARRGHDRANVTLHTGRTWGVLVPGGQEGGAPRAVPPGAPRRAAAPGRPRHRQAGRRVGSGRGRPARARAGCRRPAGERHRRARVAPDRRLREGARGRARRVDRGPDGPPVQMRHGAEAAGREPPGGACRARLARPYRLIACRACGGWCMA